MRAYRRGDDRLGRGSRSASVRRPTLAHGPERTRSTMAHRPDRRPPTSVATALQEMGILQSEGAPPGWRPPTTARTIWRQIEEWPRAVLLLCSLTCFLLLFGLIAWQPWR